MKANYVIIAALGAFALTAVSCINGNWGGKDTQIDNSVTVEIEQEPVVVPSDDIMDYGKSQIINSDKEGNLHLEVEAKGSASITTVLNEGEATEIPGQLEMAPEEEDLPDFCSSESGAVFSDARVILSLKNPSPTPVLFNGKISAGSKVQEGVRIHGGGGSHHLVGQGVCHGSFLGMLGPPDAVLLELGVGLGCSYGIQLSLIFLLFFNLTALVPKEAHHNEGYEYKAND